METILADPPLSTTRPDAAVYAQAPSVSARERGVAARVTQGVELRAVRCVKRLYDLAARRRERPTLRILSAELFEERERGSMFSGAVCEQRWGSSLSRVQGEVISLHLPGVPRLVPAEEIVTVAGQEPQPARGDRARLKEQELRQVGALTLAAIAREANQVHPR